MNKLQRCPICQQEKSLGEFTPSSLLAPALVRRIQQDFPSWTIGDPICREDVMRYRGLYVQEMIEADKGELDALEASVVDSIKEQELLAKNLNEAFEEKVTTGQRLADAVASFGGSWRFIIGFTVFLGIWVLVNSLVLLFRPFDAYPFILLNLILSCLAALQAPVIMMSQNRQEAKDRLRSENDYRTNLKAELEVRLLHEKLDYLLTHQWQRLLEIQELQLELMQERSRQPTQRAEGQRE